MKHRARIGLLAAQALLTTAVAQAEPAAPTVAPAAADPGPIPEPPIGLSASASPSGFTFGANDWKLTFYGFAELDVIHDTTQSFNESTGNAPIARSAYNSNYIPDSTSPELMPNNYAGNH